MLSYSEIGHIIETIGIILTSLDIMSNINFFPAIDLRSHAEKIREVHLEALSSIRLTLIYVLFLFLFIAPVFWLVDGRIDIFIILVLVFLVFYVINWITIVIYFMFKILARLIDSIKIIPINILPNTKGRLAVIGLILIIIGRFLQIYYG